MTRTSTTRKFLGQSATSITVGLLLLCSNAFAGNEASVSTAREIAKEGLTAFDAGRYAEANEKLSRALEVVGVPTLALYTARANVKLGKLVRASELYLLATRLSPKGPSESVQIQAQRDATKERAELMPRIPKLTLNLEGEDLDEVEVTIDEQVVPKALLGTAQFVDPGDRKLAAKRGEELVTASVVLTEGEHKTSTMRFQARAKIDGMPAVPTVETKTLVGGQPDSKPIAPQPASRQDPHQTQRTLGWVGIGLGGAGLVFGAVTGGLAMSKRSSLRDEGCIENSCYLDQKSGMDSYDTMRTLSTVGFVAGGVFAAAGLTLLLTTPKAESGPHATLLLTPGSASLVGKF